MVKLILFLASACSASILLSPGALRPEVHLEQPSVTFD